LNVQEKEKEILEVVIQREVVGGVLKTVLREGGILAENLAVTAGVGGMLR
jgi:hypothetical protein